MLIPLGDLLSCQDETPSTAGVVHDTPRLSGLHGRIVFTGYLPFEERSDGGECQATASLERNQNGWVKGALVQLSVQGKVFQRKKAPAPQAAFSIGHCSIAPHIVAVDVGGNITVTNSDNTGHDVFMLHANILRRKAHLDPGMQVRWKIDSQGYYQIGALFEDQWRNSLVYGCQSSLVHITRDDGRFAFGDIQADTAELHIFHEILGEISRIVELMPGETRWVKIEF